MQEESAREIIVFILFCGVLGKALMPVFRSGLSQLEA